MQILYYWKPNVFQFDGKYSFGMSKIKAFPLPFLSIEQLYMLARNLRITFGQEGPGHC
jgi:hypothetical protein